MNHKWVTYESHIGSTFEYNIYYLLLQTYQSMTLSQPCHTSVPKTECNFSQSEESNPVVSLTAFCNTSHVGVCKSGRWNDPLCFMYGHSVYSTVELVLMKRLKAWLKPIEAHMKQINSVIGSKDWLSRASFRIPRLSIRLSRLYFWLYQTALNPWIRLNLKTHI